MLLNIEESSFEECLFYVQGVACVNTCTVTLRGVTDDVNFVPLNLRYTTWSTYYFAGSR